MEKLPRQCARDLLETAPLVMRFIRAQVRRRRPAGLTVPQFRTLAFLDRFQEVSLSLVAEHLGLSMPAMSRLINGLVNRQLVERQIVSTNRRQIALNLTSEGRRALESVRSEVRLRLAEVMEDLSGTEQKTLHRAMEILHHAFDKRALPADPVQKG